MEDGWIKWKGGECPVADGVEIEMTLRDGCLLGPMDYATEMRWSHYEDERNGGDIVAYRIVGLMGEQQPAPITSDGGSSDYYKLTIKNKAGETLQCEMGDVIRWVFDNDFDLGNIVKGARRMALAKRGSGKAGTTVTYDANKIKWFAEEFAFWHEVF